MPANIFISGTVGLAGFSLDVGGNTTSSDAGLGLYVKAGKDWWVGADWGWHCGHVRMGFGEDCNNLRRREALGVFRRAAIQCYISVTGARCDGSASEYTAPLKGSAGTALVLPAPDHSEFRHRSEPLSGEPLQSGEPDVSGPHR